jgi:hypothetical protein
MMHQEDRSSPVSIVQRVLARALGFTFDAIPLSTTASDLAPGWAEVVRDAWIRALREAFCEFYSKGPAPRRFAVFGGKPRDESERRSGLHCGVSQWDRWELMYDVSVVELEWLDAAYANRKVPIVQRAIWLVESEVARDGTQVAEDFSKLRLGKSENRLFIAARTLRERDSRRWLDFFARASIGIDGPVYVGLVPSYSANQRDSEKWLRHTADVLLYRCLPSGASPEQIAGPIEAIR